MKKIIFNGFILTVTSIIIRFATLYLNAFVSSMLGEEGMGIFALLMTVYSFAQSVATSGISLASTRVVSEELAKNRELGAKKAVKICLAFAGVFALISSLGVVLFANKINICVFKGKMPVFIIRALAFYFPFISFSSVFSGYFVAVRKAYKSSVSQIAEIFSRSIFIMLFLRFFIKKGIEFGCFGVILGGIAAEGISFIINLCLYLYDRKNLINFKKGKNHVKKILKIIIPVGFSSYLRSALLSVKQIIVPVSFEKYGFSRERAVADFGVINAMVLPVALFPYAFVGVVANLIVPEIASRHITGRKKEISRIIEKLFKTIFIFALPVYAILFLFGEDIGISLYKSIKAGRYIRLVAPLVIFMYTDTVTDSVLKGIDKQFSVVKINIIDTVTSILLILITVPFFGPMGYILVLYISEISNLCLSVRCLIKEYNFKIDIVNMVIKPCFSIIAAMELTKLSGFSAVGGSLLCCFTYIVLLLCSGVEIKGLKKIRIMVK